MHVHEEKIKRILVYGLCERFGGTERYVMTLYQAIDRSKVQFDFLYDHAAREIPYEEDIIKLGGRVFREYYRNSDKNLPGAVSIKQLLKNHPEWEGVYVNIQFVDTSYRLIKEAKKQGLKYRVIHAHNNNYTRQIGIKDKVCEAYFHLTKRKNVTQFLACSELAGQWAFKGSKFTVIPNAVEFEKFRFNPSVREAMRSKYGIGADIKVIGFCARLCYQKNPEFLVQVFNELHKKDPHTCLLLVGDGDKRKFIEEAIIKLSLRDNVIFAGSVDNAEDYMQMMDCFLLPSRFEGFGIVLLEAQAAGLNCFTSKGVVPEATNVSGHVHFAELSAGAEYWADEILKVGFERYDEMNTLQNSDYTVGKSAKKLMKVFEL